MRTFLLLLALISISIGCDGQKKKASSSNSTETNYYFIRHAEKDLSDPSNRNPNLTEEGEARAERWRDYFKDKEIDAVYSTNYLRTMRTAEPTARAIGVTIQKYNPSELYSEDFQKATKGKNVVVVGHSNTTPGFANKASGKTASFAPIDESEYYHLYQVSLSEEDGVVTKNTASIKLD